MAKDFENQKHEDLPEVLGGALEQIRISQQRVQRVLNSPSRQSFLKAQKAIQGKTGKSFCPSAVLLKSLAVTEKLEPAVVRLGDFSVLPQQSLYQNQKLLRKASISMRPSLESMRLAAEASTSIRPFLESMKSVSESLASLTGASVASAQVVKMTRSFAESESLQQNATLARLASKQFSPALLQLSETAELQRSVIELASRPLDRIMNRSFSAAAFAMASLHSSVSQQALDGLNAVRSEVTSMASVNRLWADLFSQSSVVSSIADLQSSKLSEMDELQRLTIEPTRKSLDQVINRSFIPSLTDNIYTVLDLHSSTSQQILNNLNPSESLRSISASITSVNKSFTDLFITSSTALNLNSLKNNSFDSLHRFWLLTKVIIKLANLGWFLGRKILQDFPTDLLEILKSTDPANVTKIMGRYFRKRLDIIANELINNYPERQNLLRKTFQAHKQGHYDFSIPLFLLHADGISRHRFGGEVFMKKGRKTIASHSLGLHAEYLISNELLPIWASQANRSNDPSILNRHQIVHGESIDYGNELNSLRTISFLYWIHCLA